MSLGRERARGLQTFWPALAGAAQAAAVALPGSGQAQGWLQILSLILLASGLASIAKTSQRTRPALKQGAWLGGVFATAWLTGCFWWLYVSMHDVGGMPAPLAALAVVALASALALYYAAAAAVWVALARHEGLHVLLGSVWCLPLCGLWPN